MKSKQLYSPIIKGKLNDLKAVERLSEDARSKVKPLIEVMPLPKKDSDIEKLELPLLNRSPHLRRNSAPELPR